MTGYSIKYAYRVPLPEGGERIVLAIDRRLGTHVAAWQPVTTQPATDYPFTVLEMRFEQAVSAKGATSLTTNVIVDKQAGTLALENYAGAPAILQKVRQDVMKHVIAMLVPPACGRRHRRSGRQRGCRRSHEREPRRGSPAAAAQGRRQRPQVDGTTALHWAVRADDVEMADLLIRAGARVTAANREGVTPLQLAALNGSAQMLDKLIKAGADPNAPLTQFKDTALMMAARTGKTDGLKVLLESGARVNDKETWGGTTALMWAASERHRRGGQAAPRARRRRERAIQLRGAGQRARLRRPDAGGPAKGPEGGGVRQRLDDAADVRRA